MASSQLALWSSHGRGDRCVTTMRPAVRGVMREWGQAQGVGQSQGLWQSGHTVLSHGLSNRVRYPMSASGH
jgi:hypothetical protein